MFFQAPPDDFEVIDVDTNGDEPPPAELPTKKQ